MGGDHNRPESGPSEVRARQMGTKADPWRDGNGPAEEGPAQPEADWQEPISQGARPPGTSRPDAGHQDQRVSGEEASHLSDLDYRPSLNQVRHEPIPASHEAGQPSPEAGETRAHDGDGSSRRRRRRHRVRRRGGAADPPAS